MCSPWSDIQNKVDQLNVATRWQVTPRNIWFQPTANTSLPGAQYICSMALEQISDWTSLHWPKNVKHTFPVKTSKHPIKKQKYCGFPHAVFHRYLTHSPLLVSRTFLGLRSRHTMPCWCRLSRASRIWAPHTRTSASGSPQQVCMALSVGEDLTGNRGRWHQPSTSMIWSSPCPTDSSDLTIASVSSLFLWGGAPEENQLANDFPGATFSLGLSSQASSTPSLARATPENVPCFAAMLWQREAEGGQEVSEFVLVSVWSENTALSVLLMTTIPFLSSVSGLLLSCFESVTVSAAGVPLETDPCWEQLVSHDALPRIWVWQWRGRCKMAGDELKPLFSLFGDPAFRNEVWLVWGSVCPSERLSVTA